MKANVSNSGLMLSITAAALVGVIWCDLIRQP
jgi:hypothetical protein